MPKLEISTKLLHYLSSDFIVVGTEHFTNYESEEQINDYVKQITEALHAFSKSKVAFNIISESMNYNMTNASQKIIKKLLELTVLPKSHFTIIYGAVPCIENIRYYKDHRERFDWVDVPVIFTNWWEYYFHFKILEQDSIYNIINTTPRIKPKKFLCYNRNSKPHRLYITTQCIQRDLLKYAFFSNYFRFPDDVMYFGSTHEWFPTLYEDIHRTMYKNYDLFPLDLGLAAIPRQEQTDKFMGVNSEDLCHFEDSYFGVVTESKYAHDNYDIPNQIYGQLGLDGFMFTEKTYKFIASKKPFILAGFTGSLEMLRKSGYKTFHPYIDETYDTIENDEERIIAIVNEIERLCHLSDDEWLTWQENIESILLHNYNTLKNAGEIVMKYTPN